jgi:hypothetical protein
MEDNDHSNGDDHKHRSCKTITGLMLIMSITVADSNKRGDHMFSKQIPGMYTSPTLWLIVTLGCKPKQGIHDCCDCDEQIVDEVLGWEPPMPDGRTELRVGEFSLLAQVCACAPIPILMPLFNHAVQVTLHWTRLCIDAT